MMIRSWLVLFENENGIRAYIAQPNKTKALLCTNTNSYKKRIRNTIFILKPPAFFLIGLTLDNSPRIMN